MKDKPIIYVRSTDVPPESEKKWNEWMDDAHIPLLLKFKGLTSAARYKRAGNSDEYPRYLTVFEFDSLESYEEYKKSPELEAADEERKATWPSGSGTKTRWQVQYELLKKWEK